MKQLNKVSRNARLAVSRTRSKCAYNQWKFDTFAMCTENIEKNIEASLLYPVLAFMLFGQLASQLRIGLQDTDDFDAKLAENIKILKFAGASPCISNLGN